MNAPQTAHKTESLKISGVTAPRKFAQCLSCWLLFGNRQSMWVLYLLYVTKYLPSFQAITDNWQQIAHGPTGTGSSRIAVCFSFIHAVFSMYIKMNVHHHHHHQKLKQKYDKIGASIKQVINVNILNLHTNLSRQEIMFIDMSLPALKTTAHESNRNRMKISVLYSQI